MQFWHVEALVAAVADELVPRAHFVQLPAPAADQVPGPQFVQVDAEVAAVAADAVPALHCVQLDCAADVWYVPAPHTVHAAPCVV